MARDLSRIDSGFKNCCVSDEMGGMEDEEEVGMLAMSSECKTEDEN